MSFAIAVRIGMAPAARAVALKHAFSDWCHYYGMVHGKPPINRWAYGDGEYARLMLTKAVEKIKNLKPCEPIKNELALMGVIAELEKWKIKRR